LNVAGIGMNFQIVLCKGVNDGANLDETIEALSKYIPNGRSLSVVPVGLTKFRGENGLYKLEPFDKSDAEKVIGQIQGWQGKLKKQFGTRFVHAADEFYLKAGAALPRNSEYEGYPQLENGVGMMRSMQTDFNKALRKIERRVLEKPISVSVVTGKAAESFIKPLCGTLTDRINGLHINVYAVENEFFGKMITVTGLLTGRDIIGRLRGKDLGDLLFIPQNALRAGEPMFLDGVNVEQIERELGVKTVIAPIGGRELIDIVLKASFVSLA